MVFTWLWLSTAAEMLGLLNGPQNAVYIYDDIREPNFSAVVDRLQHTHTISDSWFKLLPEMVYASSCRSAAVEKLGPPFRLKYT